MNALDRPLRVTLFTNHAATTKAESQWTPRELAERIRTTSAPDKPELPWLKLAKFGNERTPLVPHPDGSGRLTGGSLRHDANVRAITGTEADYDREKMPFDEAEELLIRQGVVAVLYTSPSHTEDSPRWRVLCPLSSEMAPDRRNAMLGRVNGLFGGVFSRESWALSQSYYYGADASNSNPSHRVALIDGAFLDQHDDLDTCWIGPANAPKEGVVDRQGNRDEREIAELVRRVVTGAELHTCLTPLAARLIGRNVPRGTVAEILRGIMLARPEEDRDARWCARYEEIDRLVASAVAKYGTAAAARKESSRRLSSLACSLIRQGVPELEILQQLRAANAELEHPVPAEQIGDIGVWAARKVAGGSHAA